MVAKYFKAKHIDHSFHTYIDSETLGIIFILSINEFLWQVETIIENKLVISISETKLQLGKTPKGRGEGVC